MEQSKLELEVLVGRYKSKPSAPLFDQIMAAMSNPVGKILTALYTDKEQRADCYQEICLQVLSCLNKYNPERGTWWTYFHTRLLGWQKNYYQKLRNSDSVETKEWDTAEDFIDFGTEAELGRIIIEEAIDNLPSSDHDMFQQFLDGWSYREIAAGMNIPRASVHRRIKELKELVKEEVFA